MFQAFIVLIILVLIHEFGHFIAAKLFGVKVEEFGFGIPPRLAGKKIGETIYSINWLPIGGFVRLFGEDGVEGDINSPDQSRSFWKKPVLVRAGIVLAGVIMNFLLAVFIFAVIYSFTGIPRNTDNVKILDVAPGSPALSAGLVKDDVIKKVDGEIIDSVDKFKNTTETKKGREVTLEVLREGKIVLLKTVPRANPPQGEGPLGVAISSEEIYFPPMWQRPFVGAYFGFNEAILWSRQVLLGLGMIFSNLIRGQAPQGLSGPVVVVGIVAETSKSGVLPLVNLLAILSVNLALFNILPIPALDGGKLLFLIFEAIFGKRVLPKIESLIHTVGFALLILLIIAITARDIGCVINEGGLSQCVKFLSLQAPK